jgi:LAO/AO transport system kinase
MASNVGDMDVFFRSMSARGRLGGLSTATSDAVTALDAFGKDRIVIETVGAGQNEIDIVRTADSVVVLVQPGSGDDVQMLKAGILEIGDVFVVNKADMDGTARTVAELEEMIHLRSDPRKNLDTGHHGFDEAQGASVVNGESDADAETWTPEVVETIATSGDGVEDLAEVLAAHRAFLEESGRLREKAQTRYAEEIRRHVQSDLSDLVERELDARGGIDSFAAAVADRETDPYTVADEVVAPVRDCFEDARDD